MPKVRGNRADVTDVIARIVMLWMASSVVVSPFIGLLLRQCAAVQLDLVPVSPRRH
ncbi:MAG TPA: hypothetical protein VFB78_00155 [Acidimicrobiales bacterium]|nr:hypothetical protein [Acidimicrobiales bacterium]